jgi:hypothetical protein
MLFLYHRMTTATQEPRTVLNGFRLMVFRTELSQAKWAAGELDPAE